MSIVHQQQEFFLDPPFVGSPFLDSEYFSPAMIVAAIDSGPQGSLNHVEAGQIPVEEVQNLQIGDSAKTDVGDVQITPKPPEEPVQEEPRNDDNSNKEDEISGVWGVGDGIDACMNGETLYNSGSCDSDDDEEKQKKKERQAERARIRARNRRHLPPLPAPPPPAPEEEFKTYRVSPPKDLRLDQFFAKVCSGIASSPYDFCIQDDREELRLGVMRQKLYEKMGDPASVQPLPLGNMAKWDNVLVAFPLPQDPADQYAPTHFWRRCRLIFQRSHEIVVKCIDTGEHDTIPLAEAHRIKPLRIGNAKGEMRLSHTCVLEGAENSVRKWQRDSAVEKRFREILHAVNYKVLVKIVGVKGLPYLPHPCHIVQLYHFVNRAAVKIDPFSDPASPFRSLNAATTSSESHIAEVENPQQDLLHVQVNDKIKVKNWLMNKPLADEQSSSSSASGTKNDHVAAPLTNLDATNAMKVDLALISHSNGKDAAAPAQAKGLPTMNESPNDEAGLGDGPKPNPFLNPRYSQVPFQGERCLAARNEYRAKNGGGGKKKDRPPRYLQEVGPFPDWSELTEAKLAEQRKAAELASRWNNATAWMRSAEKRQADAINPFRGGDGEFLTGEEVSEKKKKAVFVAGAMPIQQAESAAKGNASAGPVHANLSYNLTTGQLANASDTRNSHVPAKNISTIQSKENPSTVGPKTNSSHNAISLSGGARAAVATGSGYQGSISSPAQVPASVGTAAKGNAGAGPGHANLNHNLATGQLANASGTRNLNVPAKNISIQTKENPSTVGPKVNASHNAISSSGGSGARAAVADSGRQGSISSSAQVAASASSAVAAAPVEQRVRALERELPPFYLLSAILEVPQERTRDQDVACVSLCYAVAPNKFYIRFEHQEQGLVSFEEKLNAAVTRGPLINKLIPRMYWRVGGLCVARKPENANVWARAVILSMEHADNVWLQFVDSGVVANGRRLDDLQPLPLNFLDAPYCFRCYLNLYKPPIDAAERAKDAAAFVEFFAQRNNPTLLTMVFTTVPTPEVVGATTSLGVVLKETNGRILLEEEFHNVSRR